MGLIQRLRYAFGYDAITDKARRKSPRMVIRKEDAELGAFDRRKLIATTRDLTRNFAVAQWAINRHLDYVSRFHFTAQTKSEAVNDALEFAWENWAARADVNRRHTLPQLIRLFESCKVIDGDAGLLKVKGGYLQGIEGSRIAKPSQGLPPEYAKSLTDHGLVVSEIGTINSFCLCDRDTSGTLKFASMVNSGDIIFGGYFSRFDQLRGVSPLASALNTFQDLYEAFEFQLIKAKVHAMFGVAIMSEPKTSAGSGFIENDLDTGQPATAATTRYEFELKPGLKLELEPGDKIETIESKTPSQEFQNYSETMLRLALLSLDIPYSFLDTTKANFSGRKMDMVEYDLSARNKREANQHTLRAVGDWKVPQLAVSDKSLSDAMRDNGLTISDLYFDFRPEGVPWIDEAAEVAAAASRINNGLSSWTRECKRRGERFKDIIEEQAAERALLAREGVAVSVSQPGQIPAVVPSEEDTSEYGGLEKWF